ncbi:Regulatory protein NosR [Nymphon striatum]|nr:Regulatory protein NosR [Nymphon striatum]
MVQEKVSLRPDEGIQFTWDELVSQGLAKHVTATHGEERALFSDTQWRSDDPFPNASDEDIFVDLWIIDVTHPHVARSVMGKRMLRDWNSFKKIAPEDETILLIEKGSHGLVGKDFVRNTAPALITANQDNFPLSLRDADLLIDLKKGVPDDGTAMVVRIDRRQGFSPVREWDLGLIATRQRGILKPEVGEAKLNWKYQADKQFFDIEEAVQPPTPFESAISSPFPLIAEEYSISLKGNSEKTFKIGKLITEESSQGGINYKIKFDMANFEDHFLSMRPFKCLPGGEKLWCHAPYPYEIKRYLTDKDHTDLEYDLIFVWKPEGEYGINLWNGVYYQLERTDFGWKGTMQEYDLNILGIPPEKGELRPILTKDLHESNTEDHFLPFIEIRRSR